MASVMQDFRRSVKADGASAECHRSARILKILIKSQSIRTIAERRFQDRFSRDVAGSVHRLVPESIPMAARSFFVVTLFATLVGIGAAEAVRPALHRDLKDPRTSLIGLCVNSGIGCGVLPTRVPGATF
jgi:hypothetical protein